MKITVWVYFSAVLLTSYVLSVLPALFGAILTDYLNGAVLPTFTEVLVSNRNWFLIVPIPHFLFAIWISCRDLNNSCLPLLYGSICTLTIVILFSIVTLALTLPFIGPLRLHE